MGMSGASAHAASKLKNLDASGTGTTIHTMLPSRSIVTVGTFSA